MKKKTKKQEVDYKKVALYIAAAVFVLTTIILIKEALLANRPKNSEILSLGNVKISEYKSKRAVITNYNDYKSFLEEYNIQKGQLEKADFRRNNYLVLIETYAKDLEYEKKKIAEITNSEEVGLSITVDTYGYCDDVENVELIAYIVPVNKDNTSKNTKINVSYNMVNDIKCNVE